MGVKHIKEKLGLLNMLVLILSVYVLFSLFIDTVFELPIETRRLLRIIDNVICVVYLLDFIQRFRQAPNKWKFLKWGWIDLLSAVPIYYGTLPFRLFRLIRLVRILRSFVTLQGVFDHIFTNRLKGFFTIAVLFTVVILLFSSIIILELETAPNSNIRTAEDAIWWTYVTMTTVGYGDYYPVTTGGRLLAVVLMTCGIGMFGTFTAYLSTWFLQDPKLHQRHQSKAKEPEIPEDEITD
jgi:voltage-gated potassium channel